MSPARLRPSRDIRGHVHHAPQRLRADGNAAARNLLQRVFYRFSLVPRDQNALSSTAYGKLLAAICMPEDAGLEAELDLSICYRPAACGSKTNFSPGIRLKLQSSAGSPPLFR